MFVQDHQEVMRKNLTPCLTSGGLLSRGYPVGASGLAQIFELVTQMRGEAGKRQVPKEVRIALENELNQRFGLGGDYGQTTKICKNFQDTLPAGA